MKTVFWFIYFWFYLLFLCPKMHKANKLTAQGNIKEADAIAQREVPKWANALMNLAGVTVSTTGLENIPKDEAVVFVGNHRSYYDIPVVLTQLDHSPGLVSKVEVEKMPLIRTWMRFLHCVFIDRENSRSAMNALHEATENVENGYSMFIFPEGTRNKGDEKELLEFKGGAFRIATKSKAKIIPVAIHNTRSIMEANGGWMKPGHVTVSILPPIETAELSRDELKALPERVREVIGAELAKYE